MAHPNLAQLPGRDPAATFPVRTVARYCDKHAHCIAISHYETRDGVEELAWVSEAHELLHVACRLGDATPVCDNELDPDRGAIEWQPTCVQCHALLRHEIVPHTPHPHLRGSSREDVARILHHVHVGLVTVNPDAPPPSYEQLLADVPDDGFLAALPNGAVELHNGASHEQCATCAPRAASCDGCRAELEASSGQ